jgi:hypothetical protein
MKFNQMVKDYWAIFLLIILLLGLVVLAGL